jgi:AraC family transcriptional regulator
VGLTTEQAYAERFERVFDYIERHLDEPLSVERLSRVANFSKFHFHRQFSQYAGINLFRYIQLLRLKRASYRLVFEPQVRIIDIALAVGFENPESFSRAFKLEFGQTPSRFRKQPVWKPWNEHYRCPTRERKQMEVRIVVFEQVRVAALEHQGAPGLLNESVRSFIDWRKSTGLSPIASSRTFGLAYDDPETTPPERFRFDICGEITSEVPANPQGVVNKMIPGGRCAVVRHCGSTDRVGESAYYLYRQWLPESGETLRDFPLFFHYLKLMPETPEHELLTDIYLPLQSRT